MGVGVFLAVVVYGAVVLLCEGRGVRDDEEGCVIKDLGKAG